MRDAPRFPVRSARASRATAARAAAVRATVAAAGLAAAGALLGACVQPRTTCGEAPAGSGPPVITTRDGELCESVRLRVADALGRMQDLYAERASSLRDLTWRWEDARTLDGFLRRVRDEAGDGIADAIARAVDEVRAHGTKPMRADCTDAERCLVRGAALGARIAFDDAAAVLTAMRRASGGSVRDQKTIDATKTR